MMIFKYIRNTRFKRRALAAIDLVLKQSYRRMLLGVGEKRLFVGRRAVVYHDYIVKALILQLCDDSAQLFVGLVGRHDHRNTLCKALFCHFMTVPLYHSCKIFHKNIPQKYNCGKHGKPKDRMLPTAAVG